MSVHPTGLIAMLQIRRGLDPVIDAVLGSLGPGPGREEPGARVTVRAELRIVANDGAGALETVLTATGAFDGSTLLVTDLDPASRNVLQGAAVEGGVLLGLSWVSEDGRGGVERAFKFVAPFGP